MTEQTILSPLDRYLQSLDQTARKASTAEDALRRELAEKMRELEHARIFAFRRMNMIRSLVGAVSGARDEAEATEKGTEEFMRELDWTGATESQREVIEKFKPIAVLIWLASKPEADDEAVNKVDREMAAFEKWFAESRNGPFLSLMDREMPELPLVEIA